jgi:hypothetical protein
MNTTKLLFLKSGSSGILLNAVLLLTVIGCGGCSDAPSAQVQSQSSAVVPSPSPTTVQVASPGDVTAQSSAVVEVSSPDAGAPDDYVYYPSYGIYYNSHRREYASLQGGAWVSQAAPSGVAVDVLQASPSVRMNFHDSPANHHAAIARQYPKTWKPARSTQQGGQHDDHGGK